MKKLTLEKIATTKDAIWNWQVAKHRLANEKPATVSPRWYELMKEIWGAEETIKTELGFSMTRTQSLLTGETFLSDYYDMGTGTPLKATK